MLRKNPIKILNCHLFFPRPLFSQPRRAFSEDNKKKNNDKENKSKPGKRLSIGEYISKFNAYLESKEGLVLKYFSGINYKNIDFSNRRILLLALTLFFIGYNLKTLLFRVQDISYNVNFFFLTRLLSLG